MQPVVWAAVVILSISGVFCQNGGYTTGVSGTVGGNSQGACVFPFTYKGVVYTECTVVDNRDVPWCSLTASYETGNRWARCQIVINATRTRQNTGNAGGSNCVFPFLYKGRTYYTCIAVDWDSRKPWCSTSANYDRDRRWGECVIYPYIPTRGGTNTNAPCLFPFWYQRRWVTGCIIANDGGFPWCSVTRNYHRDRQWGECIIGSTSSTSTCQNPYTKTDNTNSFGGALQNGVTNVEDCKAVCNQNANCLGFDYDTNPGTSSRCYLHFNTFSNTNSAQGVDQYRITTRVCTGAGSGNSNRSPFEVKAGNVNPAGSLCSFPYWKGRERYGSCMVDNWFTPWCSTTPDYNRDGQWGECSNIPTDGF